MAAAAVAVVVVGGGAVCENRVGSGGQKKKKKKKPQPQLAPAPSSANDQPAEAPTLPRTHRRHKLLVLPRSIEKYLHDPSAPHASPHCCSAASTSPPEVGSKELMRLLPMEHDVTVEERKSTQPEPISERSIGSPVCTVTCLCMGHGGDEEEEEE